MLRKLVCAGFVMTVVIGLAVADDFNATITKVDGNKVTYQKYKKGKKGAKGEKDGDPVTIEVAKDAKVAKGMFDKDAKKFVAGDAIEGGIKADVFSKATEEKGVTCFLSTDADNKMVTTILVIGKKGK
jgi:hypothetical protein